MRLKKWPLVVEEAKKQAKSKGLPLKIFFQDEARFGRINNPSRCWAPPGMRPTVNKQMVREYTYAYAAICPHDGDLFTYILPRMNGECMTHFLQELAAEYEDYYCLVVFDGAPCHKPGVLQLPKNMQLKYLPPYSPELNPTENLWDDMREKFFANTAFNSIDAVEQHLVTACCHYMDNNHICRSIAHWSSIVHCEL